MPYKDLGELGFSGTRFYAGQLETNEKVSKLVGLQFFDTIDDLRNDAIISGIESGFLLPIQNGKLSIDYDVPDTIPRKEEIKKFSEGEIKNINKIFLSNALLSIRYGFMPFEQVFNLTATGMKGLKKLAPRLPKTIHRWELDDLGNTVTGFQQYVYRKNKTEIVTIPIQNALIITHKLEGGNIEGQSEYRPLYREYMTKDQAFIDLRLIMQRLGNGIPWARLREKFAGDKMALDALEDVLKELANTKEAYIAFDGTVEEHGTWAPEPDSIRVILELINHCNETIGKSCLQMFMNLGTTSSGSRNVGDTFTELYYMSLDGIIFEITEAINEQVIKPLIDYNFGPQEAYPKLKITIDKKIDIIIDRLKAAKEGGLIAGNTDLENWILEAVGVPLTTPENKINLPVKPTTVQIPTVQSENHVCKMSETKPARFSRKPTKFEDSVISFVDVVAGLDNITEALANELRAIVEPIVITAAREIGEGKKIYEVQVGAGNRVSDTFRKYYKKVKEQASSNVKKELLRQNTKMSDVIFAKKTVKPEVTKYDLWASQQSDVASEILWLESKQALAEYMSVGISQGLTGKALSDHMIDQLMNEVGQRYGTVAGKVTAGYSMARQLTANEFSDIITGMVRSEVMDTMTCDHCAQMDGQEYNGKEEMDSAPNLQSASDNPCDGYKGNNPCRGIYIYKT